MKNTPRNRWRLLPPAKLVLSAVLLAAAVTGWWLTPAMNSHCPGRPSAPIASRKGKIAQPTATRPSIGEFELFGVLRPVLASRSSAPDACSVIQREWLLDSGERFGPIRIEEEVRTGPRAGEETVVRRAAYVAGEFLVKPRAGVAPAVLAATLAQAGAASWQPVYGSGYLVARFPSPDLETKPKAMAALARAADVVAATEGNGLGTVCSVPDDPRFPEQDSLQNTGQMGGRPGADISIVRAWDIRHTSPDVIVAVLDVGINYDHPDLAENIYRDARELPVNGRDDDGNGLIDDWRGWDFVNNDNDPDPATDHATGAASIIGARGNNALAIAGITWEVQLLNVKVNDAAGGTTANLIAGINYARTKGARIMSMSLGGYPYSDAMVAAINAARDANILMVIAAGNAGTDNDQFPSYPSSYPADNILAVANTNNLDELNLSLSSYGLRSVDLGAPGTHLLGLGLGSGYRYGNGTSSATPHVAGVAALLLAERPEATVADLRRWILDTVDPLPTLAGRCVSGGRLNAYAALRGAQGFPSITAQATGQTTAAGQSADFSITGSANGPLSYQWQRLAAGSTTWISLGEGGSYRGVTTTGLTIVSPTAAMSGDQFRCVATAAVGSVTSTAATLTVNAAGLSLLQYPVGLAIDSPGNLYVADAANSVIYKISSTGQVTTLAGLAGSVGSQDGSGSTARFNQPGGITIDGAGNLYVADTGNATIRRVSSGGAVTTLAGSASSRGSQDGLGTAALFSSPTGITVDAFGNLFVADTTNATIRQITPAGSVSTLAGLATIRGDADGTGSAARFNHPSGIATDSRQIYVTDTFNATIRRVTMDGIVTTVAGSAGISGTNDGTGIYALFNQPMGIAVDAASDSGAFYVADTVNGTLRRILPAGAVITLAGVAGIAGLADGAGGQALFNQPRAIAVDASRNLYVADTGNAAIRRVTAAGAVTTLALAADTPTPPAPPPPTAPTPPPPQSSGGGGGGGAMDSWFVGLLGLLAGGWRAHRGKIRRKTR